MTKNTPKKTTFKGSIIKFIIAHQVAFDLPTLLDF